MALTAAAQAQALTPDLVISQVYGGGGLTGATFTHDFVELHNNSGGAVSLNGKAIQYAAATSTSWNPANVSALPNVSVPAGGYFLVQGASNGAIGGPLPTADATSTTNMSSTSGKVALTSDTNPLIGADPNGQLNLLDFVGYGAANAAETAPAPALSSTTAGIRGLGGCEETDNNSSDLTAAAPMPRNSASATVACTTTNPTGIGAANPSTVGAGQQSLLTVDVTPGLLPPSSGLAVSTDLTPIGGNAATPLFDNGTNGDVTAADNVFSLLTTVAPATAPGAKQLNVTIADAQLRFGALQIALTVSPNQPPVLAAIGPRTVAEGAVLAFMLAATDPDSPTLTYSGIGLPSGASLDPSSGAFAWTPTSTQAGTYAIVFEVSDGTATDSEPVQITVTDVADTVERSATAAAVKAKPKDKKINVKGSVLPPQPGQSVTVTLLEKKGKSFESSKQKAATLNDAGKFKTKLRRPARGKCAVEVAYAGDDDSLPSTAATKSFSC